MLSKLRDCLLEIVVTITIAAFAFCWSVNADISVLKQKDVNVSEKLDLVIELIKADKLENAEQHRQIMEMLTNANLLARSSK